MIKNSILTVLLIISLSGLSFGQDLDQSISIKAYNKSLEEILTLITKKYQVSFSYMNNDLPDNKIDVDFEGISLDHALSNLLEGFGYDHLIKSGKVIIKKATSSTDKSEKIIVKDSIPESPDTPIQPDDLVKEEDVDDPDNPNKNVVLGENITEETFDTEEEVSQEEIATERETKEEPLDAQPVKRYNPGSGVLITYKSGGQKEETLEYEDPGPIQRIFSRKSDTIPHNALKRRIAHFGLFRPFSTNGADAKNYINNISIHAFVANSGGLEGFEFAGISSVISGNGSGMQVSGVANLVSEEFSGAQLSGVSNISWYDFEGLQAAGITNISYDRNLGVQLAGVANIVRGRESGLQAAGIVNYTSGEALFGQVAGVHNFAWSVNGLQASFAVNSAGKIKGIQASGFINLANKVEGAQVAGFMNQAREVKGAQVAPFLNVAKKVHGVQIGLINISDEMHGTPIGLFCLAKRNGYLDLEVFYSDDFQANAAIKVGAQHFHNIFAFSYETDNKNRWAYGYGFGSQWGRGDFRLNTDLVTYYVVEDEFPNGGFRDFELNLLSRLRFLPSLHLGDFGIFAGPTFNMMVSEHTDPESGVIGSDITPTPLYEETNFGTNWKFWIGYNIGIRI